MTIETNKEITIEGKNYTVPQYVKNVDAFKEYKTKHLKFENDPRRDYKFKNGKTLRLPYPPLKKFFKDNPDCKDESEAVFALQKEFRKTRGLLTSLKKKSTSKDGESYGLSIKQTLFEEYGPQMLEWFGDFKSPFEVHRILIQKGVKDLSYTDITAYFRNNSNKIRDLRTKIKEDYDDLSIGVKRSRLEKLDYLLQKLYEDFDKSHGSTKISISKEIRGIIEQARKEVEGDELKLTVNGRIDIHATIQAKIERTNSLQQLTIAQMVISRICNRSQGTLSYNQMVNRLAYSFYNQYNGFRPTTKMEEAPIYPSSISYDILELESKHEQAKAIEIKRDEESKVKEDVKAPELRNSLQKLIEQNKRDEK